MNTKIKKDGKTPVRDLTYIAFSATTLILCSWLRLPFIIPVTLQSFGVFLSMGLLGGKRSFFSVLLYLITGCIGLPVFSGFAGGIGYLLGSTGGYIFGFLLPPLFLWISEGKFKNSKYTYPVCAIAGLLGCYVTGTLWYTLFYAQNSGANIFILCVAPFIVPDILKLLFAQFISARLKKHLRLDNK